MLDLSKVKVSSSPHIRSDETTRQIMLDVVIALLPALAVSVFVFGWRSLVLTVFSVCGCILVYLALFSDVLDTPIEFNNMAMIFGHWISIVTMQRWNTE